MAVVRKDDPTLSEVALVAHDQYRELTTGQLRIAKSIARIVVTGEITTCTRLHQELDGAITADSHLRDGSYNTGPVVILPEHQALAVESQLCSAERQLGVQHPTPVTAEPV